MPRTAASFLEFLRQYAAQVPRLYLLGDVFEYWAGDDDLRDPFHERVVEVLKRTSEAGTKIFWLSGNRDFLVARDFANAAGLAFLTEPTVEELAGRRIVLVHGDAQCTDDKDYMQFRSQVRNKAWQQRFLAQSLAERKALIAAMRAGSRQAQQAKSCEIMDVNALAIDELITETGADILIHGHTHRPASHRHMGGLCTRYVLPDWDYDSESPRGGWLSLDSDGSIRQHQLHGKTHNDPN
jgi:UDP-2,3-diacylglucosamine hydrolase